MVPFKGPAHVGTQYGQVDSAQGMITSDLIRLYGEQ